jgi:hypothetical protein
MHSGHDIVNRVDAILMKTPCILTPNEPIPLYNPEAGDSIKMRRKGVTAALTLWIQIRTLRQ